MKKRWLAALAALALAMAAFADANSDALIKAVENKNVAEVQRLIAAGANVNAKDDDRFGNTVLMHAFYNTMTMSAYESQNVEGVVMALIKAGADVNAKNNVGATPLMTAVSTGSNWGKFRNVAKNLIKAGADVNAKRNDGTTVLMSAVGGILVRDEGAAIFATMLIEAGAKVNAKRDDGCTALMLAAEKNLVYATEVLIEAGADVNARNKDGDSALIIALTNNARYVAKLLKDAGARW